MIAQTQTQQQPQKMKLGERVRSRTFLLVWFLFTVAVIVTTYLKERTVPGLLETEALCSILAGIWVLLVPKLWRKIFVDSEMLAMWVVAIAIIMAFIPSAINLIVGDNIYQTRVLPELAKFKLVDALPGITIMGGGFFISLALAIFDRKFLELRPLRREQ